MVASQGWWGGVGDLEVVIYGGWWGLGVRFLEAILLLGCFIFSFHLMVTLKLEVCPDHSDQVTNTHFCVQ